MIASEYGMAKATVVLRLEGFQLTGEHTVGSGHQLTMIIDALRQHTTDCVWFVADLDALYLLPEELVRVHEPVVVGTADDLVAFVEPVPQFLGGVFLAVPHERLPPVWSRSFWTDDQPFEDLDGARFEIRAYDTTYIEVYTDQEDLLRGLAEHFGGTIEHA